MPDSPESSLPADIGPNVLAGAGRAIGQDISGVANSLWNFIKVPGDVYQGKYSMEQINAVAPSYALGLSALGTPIGAAALPENALGIFAGSKSLTAPRANLWAAKRLEDLRQAPETIHSTTGWFRGADDKWRHTISDESASLNPDAIGSLSNVLTHPDLFKAYPQLKDYSFSRRDLGYETHGRLNPPTREISVNTRLTPEEALSTTLHETQHAVQNIEGFSPGGNIDVFLPEDFHYRVGDFQEKFNSFLEGAERHGLSARDRDNMFAGIMGTKEPYVAETLKRLPENFRREFDLLQYYRNQLSSLQNKAYDKYLRLSGEVEARAVQEQLARGDWKTPVWQHEGYIPYAKQIVAKRASDVRKDEGDFSLIPIEHDPFSLVPVDHDPFAK